MVRRMAIAFTIRMAKVEDAVDQVIPMQLVMPAQGCVVALLNDHPAPSRTEM